jgi:transcriptional regulator with XRE-family HTH domain
MPAPTPVTLGDRIRHARRRALLTREDVASAVEVDADTVARWERGETEPRASQLLALARACDVDAAAILGAT